MSQEFESILQAARLGADWAWSALYRELSPSVLRYLRAHGAREQEDLLGEVFVQVVRNLGGFVGGERQFRSWVFMIARNRLVDEWRRADRSQVDLVDDKTLRTASGAGDAEADALRSLADERVMRVLESLTQGQRDVLFLRFFAQFTLQEVADVMGKRVGAVKALQVRGLAAIRKGMSKEAVSL